MRSAVFALVLLAGACDASVNLSDKNGANHVGGYTLEVRADQGEETYVVTAPDGKIVAARAANGASEMLHGRAVQALANQPMPVPEGDEQVAFRAPGISVSVQGHGDDEKGGDDENGDAHVSINAGGHQVEVNAQENGPGDADDRAHVRITGADEDAARDFINDADELSAEVKTQMLADLNLSAH